MTILQAIVYGIIQGLGEFLPISSSAHLVLAPWLFKWQDPGIAFDVALHLGTLIAVILFFWKDWIRLIDAGVRRTKSKDGMLFWFLVAASIPGAIIGKLFEEQAESAFRNPLLIAAMLMVMGLILYIVDRNARNAVKVENIGFARSFLIGLSQALAIIPGVSRSGITMSAGLLVGLTRESTARFSFLLSTPIIMGAGVLKLKDLLNSSIETAPFLVAMITSAVVGVLSIKFMLDYLKERGFGIFVVYRLILGAIVLAVYFMR